jgi:hypothetical protein
MFDNRRRFHRFDSDTIVEFRSLKKANEYSVGMTRDFSSAGFSFESQDYDFEHEEDLEFKLKHPQRDLFVSVQGKAVWREKSEFACVTGIELKELDNSTRKRMLEIVSVNGNISDDSFHNDKDKESVVAEKEDIKSEEELLKIYALRANGLLASYLRLHEKILKVSGTFKSIFKRINFEQLYSDSAILLDQSNSFNNELNAYNSKSFDKLSEDQKIYINQLLAFTGKLNITLQILEKRQLLLYTKSLGEDYNRNEYSSIEQQYKDSIGEYMDEG